MSSLRHPDGSPPSPPPPVPSYPPHLKGPFSPNLLSPTSDVMQEYYATSPFLSPTQHPPSHSPVAGMGGKGATEMRNGRNGAFGSQERDAQRGHSGSRSSTRERIPNQSTPPLPLDRATRRSPHVQSRVQGGLGLGVGLGILPSAGLHHITRDEPASSTPSSDREQDQPWPTSYHRSFSDPPYSFDSPRQTDRQGRDGDNRGRGRARQPIQYDDNSVSFSGSSGIPSPSFQPSSPILHSPSTHRLLPFLSSPPLSAPPTTALFSPLERGRPRMDRSGSSTSARERELRGEREKERERRDSNEQKARELRERLRNLAFLRSDGSEESSRGAGSSESPRKRSPRRNRSDSLTRRGPGFGSGRRASSPPVPPVPTLRPVMTPPNPANEFSPNQTPLARGRDPPNDDSDNLANRGMEAAEPTPKTTPAPGFSLSPYTSMESPQTLPPTRPPKSERRPGSASPRIGGESPRISRYEPGAPLETVFSEGIPNADQSELFYLSDEQTGSGSYIATSSTISQGTEGVMASPAARPQLSKYRTASPRLGADHGLWGDAGSPAPGKRWGSETPGRQDAALENAEDDYSSRTREADPDLLSASHLMFASPPSPSQVSPMSHRTTKRIVVDVPHKMPNLRRALETAEGSSFLSLPATFDKVSNAACSPMERRSSDETESSRGEVETPMERSRELQGDDGTGRMIESGRLGRKNSMGRRLCNLVDGLGFGDGDDVYEDIGRESGRFSSSRHSSISGSAFGDHHSSAFALDTAYGGESPHSQEWLSDQIIPEEESLLGWSEEEPLPPSPSRRQTHSRPILAAGDERHLYAAPASEASRRQEAPYGFWRQELSDTVPTTETDESMEIIASDAELKRLKHRRSASLEFVKGPSDPSSVHSASDTEQTKIVHLPALQGGKPVLKHHRSTSSIPGLSDHRSSPPRPPQLQRRETFEVASAGFSSIQQGSAIARDLEAERISHSWKESLGPCVDISALQKVNGRTEMKRQEVIYELCETERTFVLDLRTVLRLFAKPLRTPDGKWIAGIVPEVTRLFDWLEDIVQVHTRISTSLTDGRNERLPIVVHFAELFKPLVQSLEIHLPYLVRFESVTRTIEMMIRNPKSDFGEFVRMQTESKECKSMTLASFLLKPVQRLMKYPLFFKQLCDLTPSNHADHLQTLSLLHATDGLIRIMQEVKAREEEFELLKSLESRIKGLPEGFVLASRERRLITQGHLQRVLLSDKDKHRLSAAEELRSMENLSPDTPERSPRPSSIPTSARSPNRSGPPESQHNRPDSMWSDSGASILSGTSAGSSVAPSSSSSVSSGVPYTSPVIRRASMISTESSLYDPRNAPPIPSLPHDPKSTERPRIRGKEVPLYVFVFSDVTLFVNPISDRISLLSGRRGSAGAKDKENVNGWKLIESLGVCRVLGIKDWSEHLGHEHLIGLDLLAIPATPPAASKFKTNSAPGPLSTHAANIYVTLPSRQSSKMGIAPPRALAQAHSKWMAAFHRSYMISRRRLQSSGSISALTRDLFSPSMADDRADLKDTFRSRDSSSSGSAIGQMGEKEEREWWSSRLREVREEATRGGVEGWTPLSPWERTLAQEEKKEMPTKLRRRKT